MYQKRPNKPISRVEPSSPFTRYHVKDGDSWVSLANTHNLNVAKLIYFNFQTLDPDEVSWYLRHYTGCILKTKDGKNWRFSSGASPGVIFLPKTNIDCHKVDSVAISKLKSRIAVKAYDVVIKQQRVYKIQQSAAIEGSRRYELGPEVKGIVELTRKIEGLDSASGYAPGAAAVANYLKANKVKLIEEVCQRHEAEFLEMVNELKALEETLTLVMTIPLPCLTSSVY